MGLAVRYTVVLWAKLAKHVPGQLMALPTEVTVPAPETVTVRACWATPKVAVTVVAALIVTTQVPVPSQPPPDQPTKPAPASGTAVSVTELPCGTEAEQVMPQSIPTAVEVTFPVPPVSFLVTDSVNFRWVNAATTEAAVPMVNEHLLVFPSQAPDQLLK
jgi:hypothetical protein